MVYRPVVEDSQHLIRSRIRIRIKVKGWIRIRIKVMRIRNPAPKDENNAEISGSEDLVCFLWWAADNTRHLLQTFIESFEKIYCTFDLKNLDIVSNCKFVQFGHKNLGLDPDE
jgi:hypothetical protein